MNETQTNLDKHLSVEAAMTRLANEGWTVALRKAPNEVTWSAIISAEDLSFEFLSQTVAGAFEAALQKSRPHVTTKIFVNAVERHVTDVSLSFDTIVSMAGYRGRPSVTYYCRLPSGEVSGILDHDRRVLVVDNMRFDVCHTGNA